MVFVDENGSYNFNIESFWNVTKRCNKREDVYQIPKKEVIRKIYLPQLYPYIMATTRLSLSLIWKIVLFVELLGRSDGVGFQISMFFQSFDIKSILSYSFAFILVVLFIENFILEPLENRIKRWK